MACMDCRDCTSCGETLPLDQFAKDARRKSGRRAACKRCDRKATADRRAGLTPKPGALILVPKFPAPPVVLRAAVDPGASDAPSGGVGTYAEAAEQTIAALDPPAGAADALLVHSLRGLADLADRYTLGLDVVKDTNSLVASMVRVQRELAATRAANAKAASVAAPRSKLGRFSA